jgi:hypothetical protein
MNAFNVWAKANGPVVVTQQEFDDAVARGVKQAQEVHAINDARRGVDAGWQQELEELSRRFTGMPSVDAAEADLASLKAQFKSEAKELKALIKLAQDQLGAGVLSRPQETGVNQRISGLQDLLSSHDAEGRRKLRWAEAAVEQAKEWEPKRKRWEELKRRAREVDAALAQV